MSKSNNKKNNEEFKKELDLLLSKKDKNTPELKKKTSIFDPIYRRFNRFYNTISNNKFVKLTANILKKVNNNRAVRILTSSTIARSLAVVTAAAGITLSALTLAGVSIGAASSFILAPQFAIPLAVLSLGTVAVGVAIDTVLVRQTRSLHKENKYLSRHSQAKQLQNKILKKNPELNRILKANLSTPNRTNQKSLTERYNKKNIKKKSALIALAVVASNVLIRNSVKIVEIVIARNPVAVLRLVAFGSFGFAVGAKQNLSMNDKRQEFRENIDKLRDFNDTPGYNNIQELKIAAREQKIQTLALRKLVSDPSYNSYTDEQKRISFLMIKSNIEQKEKAIKSTYTAVGIVKDALRAHNPFSKYNNLDKLSIKHEDKDLKINTSSSEHSVKNILEHDVKNIRKKVKNNISAEFYTKNAQKDKTNEKESMVSRLIDERSRINTKKQR